MHTISLHVDLGNILMAVYTNVSNCVLGPRGLDNSFVLLSQWHMNCCWALDELSHLKIKVALCVAALNFFFFNKPDVASVYVSS